MRVSNRFWFILTEMYNCIYASHITQTYRRKCVFCQFVETGLRRERTFCVYLESILVNINTDMYIYTFLILTRNIAEHLSFLSYVVSDAAVVIWMTVKTAFPLYYSQLRMASNGIYQLSRRIWACTQTIPINDTFHDTLGWLLRSHKYISKHSVVAM